MKETILTNAELGYYAYNDTYDTMEYTWTETCHNANHGYSSSDNSNCNNTNGYETSKVQEFLEGTYINTLGADNLKEVEGYKIRLITVEELRDNLGWTNASTISYTKANASGNSVSLWVYQNFGAPANNVSAYWTMTPHANSSMVVWYVNSNGILNNYRNVNTDVNGVRPVINLLKSSV